MQTYDLYKLLKQEFKNNLTDLATRHTGQVIRRRIEKAIKDEKDEELIALDFSKIGIVDYSCADEVVVKLISRLLSGEYGNKYLLLTGINDNQKENIEVALEKRGLAIMAQLKNGKRTLLGKLNNYLRETLKLIEKNEKITAKELSEIMKLEPNTSGTRLLNLYKKKLVKRIEEVRDGGRVWVYKRI